MLQFLSVFEGKLNDEKDPCDIQELEKMSTQAIKMLQQTKISKMKDEQRETGRRKASVESIENSITFNQ